MTALGKRIELAMGRYPDVAWRKCSTALRWCSGDLACGGSRRWVTR